jgi:Secretion system C-terminal sorting domain
MDSGSLVILDGSIAPERAFLSAVPGASESRSFIDAVPNPVTGASTVHVATASRGNARLTMTDALGNQVAVLLDETLEAGEHTVPLNSAGLAAGTYFLRLSTADGVTVKRIVVVRCAVR